MIFFYFGILKGESKGDSKRLFDHVIKVRKADLCQVPC